MHSYYMLEKLAADRQQEILREARRHYPGAELRQSQASKLSNWWAAVRRSGPLRGRSTVLASPTVATS